MSPDPARWQRTREAFERLAGLDPAARESALQALGDETLAAELRELLSRHDTDTGGRLSAGAAALGALKQAAPAAPHADDRRGERLGAWRIVAPLGAGGMGDVWVAERDDGSFRAEAAIKVLRRGLDTAAVLARFAQEQQALAQLAHPGIARLLDAGRTADGLPYFVMERVVGVPIDRACACLGLEARLRLFLQLADAVSHAHRQRLVHRDLKPGNVLVTAQRQVKLLDFGVAKALDPLEGHDGLTTLGGTRPFTPQYASPEQVRGEAVTAATDVYSLGVVLHEMLTGVRPTGRGATSAREAAERVLDEEPRAPSRLGEREATDPQWRSLRPRLRGDLDNIVMKALRKSAAERYASVDELADDLRAFLERRPVRARPATLPYLLLRRLQRNRGAVVAGTLGLFGLGLGLAATVVQERAAMAIGAIGMGLGLLLALVQGRQAAHARDEAQARFDQLRRLAHQVLFEYHDLVEPLVGSTPVRRRLVQDAITYLESLALAAPRDRGLRLEIGTAWRAVAKVQRNGFQRAHLGDHAGAMHSLDQAEAWLAPLVAEDPADDLAAFELGLVLSARAAIEGEDGDWATARRRQLRASALHERHCEPDRADQRHRLEYARAQLRLARGATSLGELDVAAGHLDTARQQLHTMAQRQPDHPELDHVWVWVHALAKRLLRAQGRWAEIPAVCDAAQALLDRLHAAEPSNARFLEDLAGLAVWRLRAAGALADAAAARRWGAEGCERWQTLALRDPANALARRMHLDARIARGRALVQAGEPHEGLALLDDAAPLVDDVLRSAPDDVPAQARRVYLADAQSQAHEALADAAAAEAAGARALALADALVQRHPDHPAALTARLVARLTIAQRAARAARAAHEAPPAPAGQAGAPAGAVRSAPAGAARSAPADEARAALADIVDGTRALQSRGRLEDHNYAWRLEEAPALLAALGGPGAPALRPA